MSQQTSKYVRFGVAVAAIVIAMTYLAYTGIVEGKSYYYNLKELRAQDTSVYSKHLRVSGFVQPGSIKQSGSHAEFVLTEEGLTMPVVYKGSEPPPDTFKDNAQALVIGSLGRDGVFHATELQAKCASRYAPQQQQEGAPAQPQSKGY